MRRNLPSKLAAAVLKPGLVRFREKMDYTEYGGAPLLGLQGAVVKGHGSSDGKAFKNAIKQARTFVERDVIGQISQNLGS
jgi:glycerol-3-phosphate acyltransferase PlsX